MKSDFLVGQKITDKEILMNISRIMRPDFNATLAPTGEGKLLLLDVLAVRKDPQGLSKDVGINEAPYLDLPFSNVIQVMWYKMML